MVPPLLKLVDTIACNISGTFLTHSLVFVPPCRCTNKKDRQLNNVYLRYIKMTTMKTVISTMMTIIVTMIVTCKLLADSGPYNDAVVTSVDGGSVHTVNNHNYYK